MAGQVGVYKFSEVIFSVAGMTVDDIPEDGTIRVTYDRERITKQQDVTTGGIYSWKHAKPARVEVPILPHSPWVSALQIYRNLGKMLPISLIDKNEYGSRAKLVCTHAMLQDPEIEYGTDATPYTFIFECIHLDDTYIPTDIDIPTVTI